VDNKTGTIELRATYPNADLALVPGALVNVAVTLSQIDNATVVPHEAVNVGPDSNYLYVITPAMKAKMVGITTLYDSGTETAVKGDVKPGDKVVTEGQLRLVPGIKVVVKKTAAGSATQVPEGAQ
jgi:multidrug efflux system membrane fusion protein